MSANSRSSSASRTMPSLGFSEMLVVKKEWLCRVMIGKLLKWVSKLIHKRPSRQIHTVYRHEPGATPFSENVGIVLSIAVSEAVAMRRRPVRPEHLFMAALYRVEQVAADGEELLGVGWQEVKEWIWLHIPEGLPPSPYRELSHEVVRHERGTSVVTSRENTDLNEEAEGFVRGVVKTARDQGVEKVRLKQMLADLLEFHGVRQCLLDLGKDIEQVKSAAENLGDF